MNYEPHKTEDYAGKHVVPGDRRKPVPPVKREYSYRETMECRDDETPRKFIHPNPKGPIRKPVAPRKTNRDEFEVRQSRPETEIRSVEHPTTAAASLDDALASIKRQFALVADRVKQVAAGRESGLILCGDGGIGKSRAVFDALRQCGASAHVLNTQLTPKGLFNALNEYPDELFVIEDAEQFFDHKATAGLLRSALGSNDDRDDDGRRPRKVTWQTAHDARSFIFTGGIIVISNRLLPGTPEMEAVKTRVPVISFKVSLAEMSAMMRDLASTEFQDGNLALSAAKCGEVCEFILAEAAKADIRPNLRMFVNACRDRSCWEFGDTETHWQDLVLSRIKEDAASVRKPKSKAEKIQREFEILAELAGKARLKKDLVRHFAEVTGLSKATAYRRVFDFLADHPEIESA